MRKMFLPWLLATAMLLSLSNCVSSDECLLDKQPPVTGSEPALFVRVVDNPTTRNTAPIPPGTPLVLNEGNIYLVNADGIIVEHFIIVSANNTVTILTPENLAAGTIHRNLLDDGVVLPGVASNVAEVVIIGNTPNTTHTGDVNGEFIGGRLLNVISQHDAQNLNLFGRRALPATVNAEGNYVVEVHLAPTVARFELPSITGAGMIADFTVDGVFINNYHQNATVSGSIPGINNAPNLREYTDVAAFAYNAPNTNYTTASNNALFYWNATANAGAGFFKDGLTVRPSNQQTNVFHPNIGGGMYAMRDHVWGFQVFARNYGETGIPETEAPRLVIRLSDIRLTDGRTITDPRFVTVGSLYRLESGVRVPVSHVRAADVYHIVNGIVFDETDLSDVPNVNEMAVEVIVTLAVWGGGDVFQTSSLRQPSPAATMQIHYGGGGVINLGAAMHTITGSAGITYQWQISTDNGITWTNIQGATEQNYTIAAATMNAPAHFRRLATLGSETIATAPVRVYDAMAEYLRANLNPVQMNDGVPEVFTAAGVSFNMMPVTGGMYWRGSTLDGVNADPDRDASREDNIHLVGVNSFRMAETQVTRQLYTAVMNFTGLGLTPVTFMAFDNPTVAVNSNMSLAANRVNWYDAVVFMNRLSVISGLTPVFELDGSAANLNNNDARPTTEATDDWGNRITMNPNANGFRFPSDAEWEYAARGGQQNEYTRTLGSSGTHFRFSGSNDVNAVAWWGNDVGNSNAQIHPVRSLAPNELGLYDMSGNVWEWCWAWAEFPYPAGSATQNNPWNATATLGVTGVIRGGTWNHPAALARVAYRSNTFLWNRSHNTGLRVVLP